MPIVRLAYERPSSTEAFCAAAERILVDLGKLPDAWRPVGGSAVHSSMAEIFGVNRTSYYRWSTDHNGSGGATKESSLREKLQEPWERAGYPPIAVTIPESGKHAIATATYDAAIYGRDADEPDVAPGDDVSDLLEDIGMLPHRALLRHQWLDLAAHPQASDRAREIIAGVLT